MTPTSVVLTFIILLLLIALHKTLKVCVTSVLCVFHIKFHTSWWNGSKVERRDIPTRIFTQNTEISQAYFLSKKEELAKALCATVAACSQFREHFGGYLQGKCANVNIKVKWICLWRRYIQHTAKRRGCLNGNYKLCILAFTSQCQVQLFVFYKSSVKMATRFSSRPFEEQWAVIPLFDVITSFFSGYMFGAGTTAHRHTRTVIRVP